MARFEEEDLWPLAVAVSDIRAPAAIMKEQAARLGPKTGNLVQAEVATMRLEGRIHHKFLLVAPLLNNYRYELLVVQHGELVFPSVFVFDGFDDLPEADNEAEFVTLLSRVLRHSKTISVVQSLVAQVRAEL